MSVIFLGNSTGSVILNELAEVGQIRNYKVTIARQTMVASEVPWTMAKL